MASLNTWHVSIGARPSSSDVPKKPAHENTSFWEEEVENKYRTWWLNEGQDSGHHHQHFTWVHKTKVSYLNLTSIVSRRTAAKWKNRVQKWEVVKKQEHSIKITEKITRDCFFWWFQRRPLFYTMQAFVLTFSLEAIFVLFRVMKVLFPPIPRPPPKYIHFLEKNDTLGVSRHAPSTHPIIYPTTGAHKGGHRIWCFKRAFYVCSLSTLPRQWSLRRRR